MVDEVLKIKNCSIVNAKKSTKDAIVVVDELKINRGNSIFIIGNNGSGKSTFIKALFSIRQEDNYFDINKDAIIDLKSMNFKNILSLNNQNESNPHDLLLGYTYIEQEESFRKNVSQWPITFFKMFNVISLQGKQTINSKHLPLPTS